MKILAIATIVALTACSGAPGEKALDGAWLAQYGAVQQALAGDDYEKAAAAIKALAPLTGDDLKEMVAAASATADIEALRTAFKPISESLKDRGLPEGYNLVFCPMAFNDEGAHWVQQGDQIANPYYGASMLRCGAIVKKGGQD